MDAPVVQFEQVSKRFRRGQAHDSLGGAAAWLWKRLRRRGREEREPTRFDALHDVSFQVRPGEALGIIGPNGAGKSTALKLLAGILRPDEGRVFVRGRVAALIEVGAGFHGELTGRENVYLHGAILGMSRGEVRSRFDAIVAFAGIEDFIDTPVKRYSSGMYARLGFSIAAHVEPNVLLVDEVLSVGDAAFRLRCMQRMRELVEGGVALIFVTHQLDQMQAICSSALVLERGRALALTHPRSALALYYQAVQRGALVRSPDVPGIKTPPSPEVRVNSVIFRDSQNQATHQIPHNAPMTAAISLSATRPVPNAIVELNISNNGRDVLASFNTGRDGHAVSIDRHQSELKLFIDSLPLAGGEYVCNVRIWNGDTLAVEVDTPFLAGFVMDMPQRPTGMVQVAHAWICRPGENGTSKAGLSNRGRGLPGEPALPQSGEYLAVEAGLS
ncbi:MAG: ATP-binding cassette domain-containing protein [Phycisphaerales bacterium]|nr:ATP-binding cassette domain-containing protein [Phycisphaerales bacterium]